MAHLPDKSERLDLASELIHHGQQYERQRIEGLTAKFLGVVMKEKDGPELIDKMFERLERQGEKNFRFNAREAKLLTRAIHAIVPTPVEDRDRRAALKLGAVALFAAPAVGLAAVRYKVQPLRKDWQPTKDPEDVLESVDDVASGKASNLPPPTWSDALRSGLATGAGIGSSISFGIAFKSLADAYYIKRKGLTAYENMTKDKRHGDVQDVVAGLYQKINDRVLALAKDPAINSGAYI